MGFSSQESSCGERLPDVTLVVPTLNSAPTLKKCLESAGQLSYPKEKSELVVVDGGSRDNTIEIAMSCGAKVLVRPGTSRGAACNEGVHQTSGRIVAFTDADAIVLPDWLSKIVAEMEADPMLDAIGGPDLGLEDDSSVAMAASTMDLFRRRRDAYGWKAVDKIKGVNSAYRKDAFVELGGFDDSLFYGEESELHARMVAGGKKIKYSSDVLVYHRRHEQSVASLVRAFWSSRRMAPALLRPWTILAAMHDVTSSLATLLFLFMAVCIGVPLLVFELIQGHFFVLLSGLGTLLMCLFLYSLVAIRRANSTGGLSLFVTVMAILSIQSVLRGVGVAVGVFDLVVLRILARAPRNMCKT
jgi:glycosyltransferase involved in cell wall biosynthesis